MRGYCEFTNCLDKATKLQNAKRYCKRHYMTEYMRVYRGKSRKKRIDKVEARIETIERRLESMEKKGK